MARDRSVGEYRAMGRKRRYAQAGSFHERNRVRQPHCLATWHDHTFRCGSKRALPLRSEDPDPLADATGGHAFSNRLDAARAVEVRARALTDD